MLHHANLTNAILQGRTARLAFLERAANTSLLSPTVDLTERLALVPPRHHIQHCINCDNSRIAPLHQSHLSYCCDDCLDALIGIADEPVMWSY